MTTNTNTGSQHPPMMYIGPGMANKDVIDAVIGEAAIPLARDEDVLINYGRFRSVLRMLMEKVGRRRDFTSGGYVSTPLESPPRRSDEYVIPERTPMKDPKYERIRMAAEALARELDAAGTEFDLQFNRTGIQYLGGPVQHKHHIEITKTTKEAVYP